MKHFLFLLVIKKKKKYCQTELIVIFYFNWNNFDSNIIIRKTVQMRNKQTTSIYYKYLLNFQL